MSLRYHDGRDTRNCRLRCRAKWKTLRNLPSGYGIKLGFFSWLQNYRPHRREPELEKMSP
jgi:hypothetical protein